MNVIETTPDFITEHECLMCPHCKNECVHITEVTVWAGEAHTIINSKGTLVTAKPLSDGPPRGSVTTIHLWCENCHMNSAIRFEFHKGNVMVDTEVLQESDDFTELWRD